MKDRIDALNETFRHLTPGEILGWLALEYEGKVAFSTSLGAEDQVIAHLIAPFGQKYRIFTLDTGRLFQETYDILDITAKKYGLTIELYFPDAALVQAMVREKGINLFYDSIENRKQCCHVRKILPLQKALDGMEVWVTGMRREQSVTRSDGQLAEWDKTQEIIKVNPLIDWDYDETWRFIQTHKIPVNELHKKGFPSIGCAPCTRAVAHGEDQRAGRWWWELPENRECGLHTNGNNKKI
jgi:phosphoadenosine phosphosulfate reductase